VYQPGRGSEPVIVVGSRMPAVAVSMRGPSLGGACYLIRRVDRPCRRRCCSFELPDVLALAPAIRCPVLYLRGDQEPAERYPAEDFKARAAGECTVRIVVNCGHFYVGREDEVAATVADWLARTLRLASPPQI
jgi:pimeloyl-ACP methyl ester carboxylesterase